MTVIEFPKKDTESLKYIKALGKQLGMTPNKKQVLMCELYDSFLSQIISSIGVGTPEERRDSTEAVVAILTRLLAQSTVALEMQDNRVNYKKLMILLGKEYDTALSNMVEASSNPVLPDE